MKESEIGRQRVFAGGHTTLGRGLLTGLAIEVGNRCEGWALRTRPVLGAEDDSWHQWPP